MAEISPKINSEKTIDLFAAMSHEHGNLLAALQSWVDAPGYGVPPAEALANATKIVHKMRKLQQVEQLCVAGLRRDETSLIALAELLSHLLELATPRLRARGVSLTVENVDRPAELECNPGRVVADAFFLLLEVAGHPRDSRQNLVVSVDPTAEGIDLTAFLDSAPNARKTLRIPGVVRG